MKKTPLVASLVAGVLLLNGAAPLTQVSADSKAPTKITLWHSMTAANEYAIKQLAKEFNASQSKYKVVPQFEGQYVDALPKYLSVAGTDKAPVLFQSNDISTKQLATSGVIEPISTLVKHDGLSTKDIRQNALNYYSIKGKLYSMPFNSSAPVLYYNKDAFKAAGIDDLPQSPSYSDITNAAKKLTEANGTPALSILPYGWLFEELVANQNSYLINKSNGRAGNATKATFNSPAALNVLNWIQENADAKTLVDYGTGADASDNDAAGFAAGKDYIMMGSSANMGMLADSAKFNVGVTYLPHPDNQDAAGVAVGGASIWLSKDKSTAEQKGAAAFLKFATNPKSQAEWAVATGYFAINKKSDNTSIMKDAVKKNPNLQVALNQLSDTKLNNKTAGASMTAMPQERINTQNAMENVMNGKDPKKELAKANKQTTADIKSANEQTGVK